MLKTNASKQACMRAYMHDSMKGCAFLRMRANRTVSLAFMHACVVI